MIIPQEVIEEASNIHLVNASVNREVQEAKSTDISIKPQNAISKMIENKSVLT